MIVLFVCLAISISVLVIVAEINLYTLTHHGKRCKQTTRIRVLRRSAWKGKRRILLWYIIHAHCITHNLILFTIQTPCLATTTAAYLSSMVRENVYQTLGDTKSAPLVKFYTNGNNFTSVRHEDFCNAVDAQRAHSVMSHDALLGIYIWNVCDADYCLFFSWQLNMTLIQNRRRDCGLRLSLASPLIPWVLILLLLLQLIPTFMWGRCTMTYASM